ncbi:MAG: glycine--tRNA ligase [Candidatus Bathyarchaeota archaeon]|nr:glycine--tRNA ligase [Candidatus Bathyarchaeota archaeon]MDH5532319.1 glycine--tRNA ligase [Candidatus Bathyarchaeota archaeon]MDH5713236.1 glycine--tRNA ligase [Candidatus Bathyarchaeota archaeon]
MRSTDKFEIISEMAKRRGYFWPSFEIYGGVSGFVTLGPLGSTLKRKIEGRLRDFFIRRLGLFEIETSVIMPGKVFEASGHVEAFQEPMVECKACKRKFRADHLLVEFAGMSETDTEKLSLQELMSEINKREIHCPECDGNFGEPKRFLTMFKTTIGPYSESIGYGRPEAAQGIFVEYKRIYEYTREKLPFGVAIIGHALRNEISPRQGPIRLREFTIMDLEFFFDPEKPQCIMLREVENETLRLLPAERVLKDVDETIEVTVKEALSKGLIRTEWQAFFMALSKRFLAELGVPEEKQRFIEKLDWERAHYSVQGYDQQVYLERWGWVEVSGHNYRTDYDLRCHMEFSGVDMTAFKKHKKPIIKEEISIKPLTSKIGPAFKEDTSRVVKLLSTLDPSELEASFKKQGFHIIKSFKILPEHVEITHKTVKEKGKRFIPHVVEPSFGSDRLFYVTLEYAYKRKEGRTLLSLPRDLAPVGASVFPLVSKDGLPEKARQVYRLLIDSGFTVEYDESGSIGRRYARADEVGTPLGVTVDYQTLKDDTVTVRDRDTWRQVRNKIDELPELLNAYFRLKIEFKELGQPVES